MNNPPQQVLQTSHDPKELTKAAAQLAASQAAADQQALLQALTSRPFLAQLNTEDEYAGPPRQLRVRRVLETLGTNSAPAARQTLLALLTNTVFVEQGSRVEALIPPTASVRPPPLDLIAFWDRYSQPDDGYTPLTIRALFENNTEPAMRLFEKKLTGPAHEQGDKFHWLRTSVMTHRNAPVVLEACTRLLQNSLPAELREELIDVLFDYKPGVWFTPAVNYNPPPLTSYPPKAREELKALGDYILEHLAPREDQKAAIRRTLSQFQH